MDYVDFIHMHAINWERYSEFMEGPGKALMHACRVKDEDLARHISFSFRDKPDKLIKLIDTDSVDAATVQYNLLDQANTKQLAEIAEALGI